MSNIVPQGELYGPWEYWVGAAEWGFYVSQLVAGVLVAWDSLVWITC